MERELLTVGGIADLLEEPPARVAYIISKYRLKAIKRVGIIRLFDQSQVQLISQCLSNIQVREANRCAVGG